MNQGNRYTAKEVAEKCGVEPSRIRQIASDWEIGQKFGRDWIFTESEMQRIKNGRRAYTRKQPTPEPTPDDGT